MKGYFTDVTFKENKNFKLILDFSGEEPLSDEFDIINIYVEYLSKRRGFTFFKMFSVPFKKGGSLQEIDIENLNDEGVYWVSRITLVNLISNKSNEIGQNGILLELCFFYSKSEKEILSLDDLNNEVSAAFENIEEVINLPIITEKAKKESVEKNFEVLVFSVGTLINKPQILDGVVIKPLSLGFNHKPQHDLVKNYMKNMFSIDLQFDNKFAEEYANSTPTFVIDYKNVKAVDAHDASSFCLNYTEDLYSLIAYIRGQRANSFSTVVINKDNNEVDTKFYTNGYKGNFIDSFNSISFFIETYLPITHNNNWIKFLLKVYSEAITENDYSLAAFKYWAIVELVAKKTVKKDDYELFDVSGKRVPDSGKKGNYLNSKNAKGKVYKYLFDIIKSPTIFGSKGEHVTIFEYGEKNNHEAKCTNGCEIFSLLDIVEAWLEIRN